MRACSCILCEVKQTTVVTASGAYSGRGLNNALKGYTNYESFITHFHVGKTPEVWIVLYVYVCACNSAMYVGLKRNDPMGHSCIATLYLCRV